MIPDLRRFMILDLRKFTIPELRKFMIPDLRRFTIPKLRRFMIPDLRRFTIILKWTAYSREEAIVDCHFRTLLKNLFHGFRQTRRFEGVRILPNSPTLAPRGSGLTLTIRFHENF
jgi:hypothetical protein